LAAIVDNLRQLAEIEAAAASVEEEANLVGVRERSDWERCIHTLEPGFRALGAELEPVHSYTDHNCMKCGSCLQGCPTNAGKSTMTTWIHPAWAEGKLDLRAEAPVERVLIEDRNGGPEATGVEYVDAAGRGRVRRLAGRVDPRARHR